MKKFLLIITVILLFGSNIFSKKEEELKLPLNEEGKVVYTEVIEIPDTTKDILYSKALEWFAKVFNSAKNVIQLQDKENGKIIGKPVIGAYCSNYGDCGIVKYTLAIYTKDNKYKYEILDFYHDSQGQNNAGSGGAFENEKPECGKGFLGAGGLRVKDWNKIRENVDKEIKLLIINLKDFMSKKKEDKDNW